MTTKDFIEKAIEGGWKERFGDSRWSGGNNETKVWNKEAILLNPLAWKAVGKVEGWTGTGTTDEADNKMVFSYFEAMNWKTKMHRMIDALAEGKSIQQFLETL